MKTEDTWEAHEKILKSYFDNFSHKKKPKKLKMTKKELITPPTASIARVPSWFTIMFYDTKRRSPTARTCPELLAYRAYLLGRKTKHIEMVSEARKIMDM
jgi:hypothetical protein